MKINFKYSNLQEEWKELLIVNPKLVQIGLLVADRFGDSTITHIYRAQAQQHRFYPNEPDKISVHQLWRGLDFSIRGISNDIQKEVVAEVNNKFIYGKDGINTAIIHNIGAGTHLHLQTIK